MDHSHSFAVMRFRAQVPRDECLNVGLAIITDGKLDVRVPRKLDKLRAISAALDLDYLHESLTLLADLDSKVGGERISSPAERFALLGGVGPVEMSECGTFSARDKQAYEESVNNLLKTLVDPEPVRIRNRHKRSKLMNNVKSAFLRQRVLAKKGEDIAGHRVVSNVKIAEGLHADFVLKNGAMHIIETVDAANDDNSVRKMISDIAVSALVLEQARMHFGSENTKSRIVFEISTTLENIAMPSLQAAENQGADLYNWASQDDQRRLIDSIACLATPYELKTRGKNPVIYTSAQSMLKLN